MVCADLTEPLDTLRNTPDWFFGSERVDLRIGARNIHIGQRSGYYAMHAVKPVRTLEYYTQEIGILGDFTSD